MVACVVYFIRSYRNALEVTKIIEDTARPYWLCDEAHSEPHPNEARGELPEKLFSIDTFRAGWRNRVLLGFSTDKLPQANLAGACINFIPQIAFPTFPHDLGL